MANHVLFFFWGLLGILGHILFKLKHEGMHRFARVWHYIRDNQIQVALSIFVYLAVYVVWTSGILAKKFPDLEWLNYKIGWLSIIIAYLSDSIFRNFKAEATSAKKRNGN